MHGVGDGTVVHDKGRRNGKGGVERGWGKSPIEGRRGRDGDGGAVAYKGRTGTYTTLFCRSPVAASFLAKNPGGKRKKIQGRGERRCTRLL